MKQQCGIKRHTATFFSLLPVSTSCVRFGMDSAGQSAQGQTWSVRQWLPHAMHGEEGCSPSKCLEIRVILLLLRIRVFKRGSFGKPSRMMTLLSDRSMLSN